MSTFTYFFAPQKRRIKKKKPQPDLTTNINTTSNVNNLLCGTPPRMQQFYTQIKFLDFFPSWVLSNLLKTFSQRQLGRTLWCLRFLGATQTRDEALLTSCRQPSPIKQVILSFHVTTSAVLLQLKKIHMHLKRNTEGFFLAPWKMDSSLSVILPQPKFQKWWQIYWRFQTQKQALSASLHSCVY